MATADQFTYSAIWSEADQEWVGLCDGFDEAMNWMAPVTPISEIPRR